MSITVKEIRERFPEPVTNCGIGYCVGGAFCMSTGEPNNMPIANVIAECLQRTNVRLSGTRAMRYARQIVKRNDAGDFEAAWQVLDAALSYTKPK